MDKKRSKGVIIFASLTIVGGVFGLLGAVGGPLWFSMLSREVGVFAKSYIAALGLLSLVAGVGVLMLKAWGRNLIMLLALLGILNYVLLSPLMHKYYETEEYTSLVVENYYRLPEETKSRIDVTESVERTKGMAHGLQNVVTVLGIMYMLGLLYFFTREKVREQFE